MHLPRILLCVKRFDFLLKLSHLNVSSQLREDAAMTLLLYGCPDSLCCMPKLQNSLFSDPYVSKLCVKRPNSHLICKPSGYACCIEVEDILSNNFEP